MQQRHADSAGGFSVRPSSMMALSSHADINAAAQWWFCRSSSAFAVIKSPVPDGCNDKKKNPGPVGAVIEISRDQFFHFLDFGFPIIAFILSGSCSDSVDGPDKPWSNVIAENIVIMTTKANINRVPDKCSIPTSRAPARYRDNENVNHRPAYKSATQIKCVLSLSRYCRWHPAQPQRHLRVNITLARKSCSDG